MKVLVTQLGARRRYIVPAAFQEAGVLQRFVTDYYQKGPIAGLARSLPLSIASRVAARSAADLPSERVAAFPVFAASNAVGSALQLKPVSQSRQWIRTGQRFASLCKRHLSKETTHVYAFTSAARELFIAARRFGAKCVLDHATAPRKHEMRLVHEEHARFPAWAASQRQDSSIDEYHERQLDETQLADAVICNSTFAKRTLLEAGVVREKISVVPLGVRLPEREAPRDHAQRSQSRLRVLYVGGEALRKGVPYLVDALKALRSVAIEARFIGDLGLSPHGIEQIERVGHVIGSVPSSQMERHFAWADVLVLPSVSDTFGLVIIEAMARGLPVIASDHTGGPDVLRERVDGFVVPIRDSDAIAQRLDLMASRPDMLAEMSRNAATQAVSFSLNAYRERLVSTTRMLSDRDQLEQNSD